MANKKPGRPKAYENVKPIENVECIICFKTFDKNNARSLDQLIINDTKFCSSCFQEILNQEYHDPIDDMIKDFWSGKIRYGKYLKK